MLDFVSNIRDPENNKIVVNTTLNFLRDNMIHLPDLKKFEQNEKSELNYIKIRIDPKLIIGLKDKVKIVSTSYGFINISHVNHAINKATDNFFDSIFNIEQLYDYEGGLGFTINKKFDLLLPFIMNSSKLLTDVEDGVKSTRKSKRKRKSTRKSKRKRKSTRKLKRKSTRKLKSKSTRKLKSK